MTRDTRKFLRIYGRSRTAKPDSGFKAALNAAFRALRKRGVIARQEFLCCRTCAGYAIAEEIGKWPEEKRNKVTGIVFTTRQDKESTEAGDVFLKYGDVAVDDKTYGLPTEVVGRMAREEAERAGLFVAWDGNSMTCVRVLSERAVTESVAEALRADWATQERLEGRDPNEA
jgi:hypothetical protein